MTPRWHTCESEHWPDCNICGVTIQTYVEVYDTRDDKHSRFCPSCVCHMAESMPEVKEDEDHPSE